MKSCNEIMLYSTAMIAFKYLLNSIQMVQVEINDNKLYSFQAIKLAEIQPKGTNLRAQVRMEKWVFLLIGIKWLCLKWNNWNQYMQLRSNHCFQIYSQIGFKTVKLDSSHSSLNQRMWMHFSFIWTDPLPLQSNHWKPSGSIWFQWKIIITKHIFIVSASNWLLNHKLKCSIKTIIWIFKKQLTFICRKMYNISQRVSLKWMEI